MRWLSVTTPNEWQTQSQSAFFSTDRIVMKRSQIWTNAGNRTECKAAVVRYSQLDDSCFFYTIHSVSQTSISNQILNEWLHRSSRAEHHIEKTLYKEFFFFFYPFRKAKIFDFQGKHSLCPQNYVFPYVEKLQKLLTIQHLESFLILTNFLPYEEFQGCQGGSVS